MIWFLYWLWYWITSNNRILRNISGFCGRGNAWFWTKESLDWIFSKVSIVARQPPETLRKIWIKLSPLITQLETSTQNKQTKYEATIKNIISVFIRLKENICCFIYLYFVQFYFLKITSYGSKVWDMAFWTFLLDEVCALSGRFLSTSNLTFLLW